ncbi:MFS transporter [Actinophytocola sp.]|uniref:MFS transporter n=1 Tax=Actinophytocola sp. TaxID=1872138 RepID=UPI002ED069DE
MSKQTTTPDPAVDVVTAAVDTRTRPRGPLLALVCVGIFMVYLDGTIVTVALPAISTDLGGNLTDLQWVLNAYILVFACLLLTAGALGDVLGRRRVFIGGLVGFTVASALCALAPNVGLLFAARATQGVFAAALIPVSLALVHDLFADPKARATAVGVWSGIGGIALVAGPVLGGPLVESLGWQSVFWINVPVGVAVVVALLVLLPAGTRHRRRLDPVGQTLLVVALVGLTYALIEGNTAGWTAAQVLAGFVVAALALPAFLIWERRVSDPVLPLSLLRNRLVVAACSVNFLSLFGLYGALFLLTIYLQEINGLTATQTGVRLIALTAAILVASFAASLLAARMGARWLVFAGSLSTSAGLLLLSQLEVGSGFGAYWPALVLLGAGVAFAGAPATVVLLASVPAHLGGLVSGVFNTFRQIGAVFGVALGGLLLIQHMRDALPGAMAALPLRPEQRNAIVDAFATGDRSRTGELPERLRQAVLDAGAPVFTDGMRIALLVAAAGALLGAVCAAVLFRDRAHS